MRPTATDVARSVIVCLSVCLCVGHTDILCKNSWRDRDAVWGNWLLWVDGTFKKQNINPFLSKVSLLRIVGELPKISLMWLKPNYSIYTLYVDADTIISPVRDWRSNLHHCRFYQLQSHVTKTRTNIKNTAWSNLDTVSWFNNPWSVTSSRCKGRRR